MAKIKTRDAVKGTIKTIDKAAVASGRMKSAYAKTRDKAEQSCYAEENSATEYAADKVSHTAERVTDEGVSRIGRGTVLTAVWNGVPALYLGVPSSAVIWKAELYRNIPFVRMV